MTSLLQRELVYVTGKGGVGKTTVALALALAAARAGRRVALCEVAGQTRAARLYGAASAPGRELAVAPGLWATTVDPHRALEEWAGRVVGSRRLVGVLGRSNAFAAFVAAAPGARELLSITKAWELGRADRWTHGARRYDLVIVDGPASGHGLGMLRTPHTFAEIARVGPIATQARRVAELLEDPSRSGMVAVAQPAELPVTETLELEERLRGALGRGVDRIVVNGLLARRFSARDVARLGAANGRVPPAVAEAVRSQAGQAAAQQGQLRRLRRDAIAAVATLPFLAVPELRPADVEGLAALLGERLAS
jgi:hypothetical protein